MKNKSLHVLSNFFIITFLVFGTVFAQSEEQLKKDLEKTEQEIREQEVILNAQKAKSNIILGEVKKLTTQIKTVQKNIDAKSSVIKEIGSDITIKNQTVNQLNDKLDRSKEALGELVRAKNKIDDVSIFEIITAHENISDFYVSVDSVSKIQKSVYDLLDQIRDLRGLTEDEKIKLEEKKTREQEIKAKIEVEKKQVSIKEVEQKNLLASSKAIEQSEAQKLAEKQAKAAAIRSALFALRDTGNLSFEQAQAFAESAAKLTGVRAAFILGILRQETNIGQYLGSCVITDLESAAMKHVTSGAMYTDGIHPTRDLPPLKDILSRLGRDPLTTRVSCPQSFGYGGAMGPSQFIPSTWKLYESRIAQYLGVSIVDPWNARHAIMGTALLLQDNGAITGDTVSEKNAACKYYSGKSCTGSTNPAVASYGNSVLGYTATYQANIDFLKTVD